MVCCAEDVGRSSMNLKACICNCTPSPSFHTQSDMHNPVRLHPHLLKHAAMDPDHYEQLTFSKGCVVGCLRACFAYFACLLACVLACLLPVVQAGPEQ